MRGIGILYKLYTKDARALLSEADIYFYL